jgi:lysophospholipase L1-like esterase
MTTDRRPSGLPALRGRTLALALALVVAVAATVFAVTSTTATSAGAGPTTPSTTPVPAAPSVIPGTYVALGDSYTSGPDVPVQLGPTTTPAAPAACQRSSANYPSLTARALGLKLDDVSCGGATTVDMSQSQGTGIPPQFDALQSTTALVTVGIGGNDLGFSTIASNCAAYTPWGPTRVGWTCQDHYSAGGVDQLAADTTAVSAKVTDVLREVRERSPGATVFVVGYPDILPPTGSGCWPSLPFRTSDLNFLRHVEAQLDAALATAAANEGAHYVDTATPSSSHSACTPAGTRWVEPVVPTAGTFPLHPDATGMAGTAAVLEDAIQSSGTLSHGAQWRAAQSSGAAGASTASADDARAVTGSTVLASA